jgi:hypothetical protein
MYVVPIALHKMAADVKQIWVLLERNGTHLMSLDLGGNTPLTAAREFADTNGIALDGDPIHLEDLVFLRVDTSRTDFSAFYTWREVLPGTVPWKEVWRQFTWVSDSLDVNTFLNEIRIGEPEHSVYSVLNAYLKTNQ